MSRKRKGSETYLDAPRTPPPSQILFRNALIKLNHDAGLDIPHEPSASKDPQNLLRNRVSACYTKFFWHDKVSLEQAVSKFLSGIQSLTSVESRYRRLLTILESIETERFIDVQRSSQPSLEEDEEQFQNMTSLEPRPTNLGIKKYLRTLKNAPDPTVTPPPSQEKPENATLEASITNMLLYPPGMSRRSVPAPISGQQIQRLYTTSQTQVEHLAIDAGAAEASDSSNQTAENHVSPDTSGALLPGDYAFQKSLEEEYPSPSASEELLWISSCTEMETSEMGSFVQHAEPQSSGAHTSNGTFDSFYPSPQTSFTLQSLGELLKDKRSKIDNVWAPYASNRSILTCIPLELQEAPFVIQCEVQRMLQNNSISSEDLLGKVPHKTLSMLYEAVNQIELNFIPGFSLDIDREPSFNDLTLKAELSWTGANTGPLFKLRALPPKEQKTSALQREFGCNKVLHVDLKFPDAKDCKPDLMHLRRWFSEPQKFLGQIWTIYNVQCVKREKKSSHSSASTFKAIFFAESEDISIAQVVNWALPILENGDQAARKAYSRLELPASSSIALKIFKASDVEFNAPNILANGEPEDDRFVDPELAGSYAEPSEPSPRVMNDGCDWISHELLLHFQRSQGIEEPPSVLQGRFAGAKGIWVGAPQVPVSNPHNKQIQVNESQIKVKRNTLEGCNDSIRTFNVVKANGPVRPAPLYVHFIPILEARGVPKDAILNLVQALIQQEGTWYLNALDKKSTLPLREWISSSLGRYESYKRDFGLKTLAGFPVSDEEKVIHMLEAGFNHKVNHYLSHMVRRLGIKYFEKWSKRRRFGLPQTISLIGIPDPKGVLQPGEIHVSFSRPFKDATGTIWRSLDQMDALVGRNPAMAPWDIQKVRMVFRPELMDIPDVAIFSIKGKRPLAEKLQGGDYDGDTFWICWEPTLVEPFRNAPAPWQVPDPAEFGIITDRSKLSVYVNNPDSRKQCLQWLSKMAVARMKLSMLGRVSRLHERVTYASNTIDSDTAITLVHLHDHLVDADKQGYSLSENAFTKLKERLGITDTLPDPFWKDFINAKDKSDVLAHRRPQTTTDELFAYVIEPEIRKILEMADEILVRSRGMDEDVTRFYHTTVADSSLRSAITSQIPRLKERISELHTSWSEAFRAGTYKQEWNEIRAGTYKQEWNEIIAGLRIRYDAIQPDLSKGMMRDWVKKQGHDMSMWEKFKASAFAEFAWRTNTPGALVMNVAGWEICRLKAHETGFTRTMTNEYYCAQKFRRPKSFYDDTVEESEEEEEEDVEMQCQACAVDGRTKMQP